MVTRNLLLLRNSNFSEADERQSVTSKKKLGSSLPMPASNAGGSTAW